MNLVHLRRFLATAPQVLDHLDERIYPNRAPQAVTVPFAVISEVSDTHTKTLVGAEDQLHFATVDLVIYGETYQQVADARDGVVELFNRDLGYSGPMGGIDVDYAWVENHRGDHIAPLFGDDVAFHELTLTLEIRYRR